MSDTVRTMRGVGTMPEARARIPKDTLEAIEAIAARNDRTTSSEIRRALRLYVQMMNSRAPQAPAA